MNTLKIYPIYRGIVCISIRKLKLTYQHFCSNVEKASEKRLHIIIPSEQATFYQKFSYTISFTVRTVEEFKESRVTEFKHHPSIFHVLNNFPRVNLKPIK